MSGMPFATELVLRPGRALPTILGQRIAIAPRLARGRSADDLPPLLAGVFSMCAHAHRLTARRAVAAARGAAVEPSSVERIELQAATARDQLLRIAHDWPRLLGGTPLDLRGCPMWRASTTPAAQLAALPGWLATEWFDEPLKAWLDRHSTEPRRAALHWCEARHERSPLAALLWAHRHDAIEAQAEGRPLTLLDAPQATLPRLAERITRQPGFCTEPEWQGAPAETGPWTRACEALVPMPDNAWMRLIARLADLLSLARPQGATRLAHGALATGAHSAIAWTETARGLLVHAVQLDAAGERIVEGHVLAPTEWNFHPRGVLARALQSLRGPRAAAQARCLAAAFDPCVPFRVERVEEAACTS